MYMITFNGFNYTVYKQLYGFPTTYIIMHWHFLNVEVIYRKSALIGLLYISKFRS